MRSKRSTPPSLVKTPATSASDVTELINIRNQLKVEIKKNAVLRALADQRTSEAVLLAKEVAGAQEKLHKAGEKLEILNRTARELAQTRLAAVFNNALDGMMTIDANGIIESFNPSCERIFGYMADEVIGKHMKLLMPNPGRRNHEGNLFQYLETVKAEVFGMPGREVISERKDGSAFTAEMSISTFQLEDGQYFTGIIRDVTARKTAEEQLLRDKSKAEQLLQEKDTAERQLKEQMHLLATIVENLPIALFAKDVQDDYRLIMWNAKAEQLMDLKKEEVLGQTDYNNFPSIEADCFRATDEKIMASGLIVDIAEEDVTTARGTWTAHTIKVPIYDEAGKPTILLGISEDITERKQAEKTAIARIEADRANQAKSEFLANMSHELRTPLNSIMGMTSLLEDTSLMADQREMVNTVYQSSSALLEIVNDILDLSRIEANVMILEPIGIDIVSLIGRTIDTLKPFASKKNLGLSCVYNTKDIPYVTGDPGKIARILVNLVNNAIKYTVKGAIRVEIDYKSLPEGKIQLSCKVFDTGVGIESQKLGVIFEKFTQVDNSTTRKFGGTGLGLAITKHLVEMMGGSVHAESTYGKGSVFSIVIPLDTTATLHTEFAKEIKALSQLHSSGIIPTDKVRILVAEDHALNQAYIKRVFAKYKIEHFNIVENGNAVLEAMAKTKYDIILMDCHMPEMNGYETTEHIRILEANGVVHIPIVAMTANAMTGDREKCLKAGMDDYVSKPFSPEKLKNILVRWIQFSDNKIEDPAALEQSAPVDFKNLRSYSEGDREEERHFVALFIQQNSEVLERLRANCVEGESEEWVAAAHLGRGGAASIGATYLCTLAGNAQNLVVGTAEERRNHLSALETETKRVLAFLSAQGLC